MRTSLPIQEEDQVRKELDQKNLQRTIKRMEKGMYCPNCLSDTHWLSSCDELTPFPAKQFNLFIETERQTRSLLQKTPAAGEDEARKDQPKPSMTSNHTNFTLVGKAQTSTKLTQLIASLSVTQGHSLPVEATLSASLKVPQETYFWTLLTVLFTIVLAYYLYKYLARQASHERLSGVEAPTFSSEQSGHSPQMESPALKK